MKEKCMIHILQTVKHAAKLIPKTTQKNHNLSSQKIGIDSLKNQYVREKDSVELLTDTFHLHK